MTAGGNSEEEDGNVTVSLSGGLILKSFLCVLRLEH